MCDLCPRSLVILGANASELPAAVGLIFSAFSFEAGVGGFVGIAIQGIKQRYSRTKPGLVQPRLHTPPLKPMNRFAKELFHP